MTSMFIYSSSTTKILGKSFVCSISNSYTLTSSHGRSTSFSTLMRGLVVLAMGILRTGSAIEKVSGGGE